MSSYFKVLTQGQTLRVKILNAAGTAPTVYTSSAISGTHTMPLTISSDTEFWFATALDRTPLTITVTRQDGTVVYSDTKTAHPDRPHIFGPEPTRAQLLTDVAGGNGLLRDGAFAETVNRLLPATNGSLLSDGRLSMVAIHLEKGQVVNSITFVSATTAANGPTHQLFGLFSSARVLLATSADDTSTAWAANSAKTLAMTTPYTVPSSGLYYLGIMVTASSAVPTIHCYAGSTVTTTLTPILSGTADSSLTTALPATATTITPVANVPYAYVS